MFRKIAKKIYLFFLKKKFFSSCVMGENSVLYGEAEIINNLGDKKRIKIDHDSHIRGQLLTFGHGGNISIGDYCYVGRNTYIWSGQEIEIGNRVLISHNCNVFDNDTHPMDAIKRHEQFKKIITDGQPKNINLNDKKTIIEDDVLIGAGAIILKGVRIGKGAIIGAGSVVTKNIEPFTVVAGNPAVFIKKINL